MNKQDVWHSQLILRLNKSVRYIKKCHYKLFNNWKRKKPSELRPDKVLVSMSVQDSSEAENMKGPKVSMADHVYKHYRLGMEYAKQQKNQKNTKI